MNNIVSTSYRAPSLHPIPLWYTCFDSDVIQNGFDEHISKTKSTTNHVISIVYSTI